MHLTFDASNSLSNLKYLRFSGSIRLTIAESFFASLKKEELYRKDHPSDRAFQASIASYIEFYNNKRPHRTLKNLTPYQMEENFCATVK